MRRARSTSRLDPSGMRLPLIALIDVVLFLLMYFLFAGSLAAEERELAAALRTEQSSAAAAQDLSPQIVTVDRAAGGTQAEFRVGARVCTDRSQLRQVLEQLPKSAGVIVRVSPRVTVAEAATALQVCRDAGFEKLSYVPMRAGGAVK